VLVIPVEKDKPVIQRMFAAVTKEFSSEGLSFATNEGKISEEVILGFRWEGAMTFLRGESRPVSPMGAGFYQQGVYLSEVISFGDYPELQSVAF
jgi:hypothetical protein